jgi:multisubunit Na+/H+ antiporter MnhC subunit
VVVQALGMVFTFGTAQPGVQALVLTLLCIAFATALAVVATVPASTSGARTPPSTTLSSQLQLAFCVKT